MDVRGWLGAAWLPLAGVCGCTAPTADETPSGEAPSREEPLEVTVDSLDVVHGALRVTATMVDGAADVSVRLGSACDHREVGGGVSTPSTLVWALGDEDVAEAIRCGLVLRACARDGRRGVNKIAELAVQVAVASPETGADDEGPRLEEVAPSGSGVRMLFSHASRKAHLRAGGSLLAAEPDDPDDETAAEEDRGRYVVPYVDFARSVLGLRPLVLDGRSFATSLSVAGTSLDTESSD